MLRDVWNKAVTGYQSFRQTMDHDVLDNLAKCKKEAQQGFETQILIGPYGYYSVMEKVPLTPDEAKKVIEDCDKERARILESMKARAEKYGLKP
ncbi:MAG: hypothetical protein KJ667_08465 [Alphaproteobacteria bacterium]|nr:hypothetical protein [Alphaproteobacteria bacterium]